MVLFGCYGGCHGNQRVKTVIFYMFKKQPKHNKLSIGTKNLVIACNTQTL